MMRSGSRYRRLKSVDGQRGNALFLILIAVALFAALSYAVTQSGKGSGTIDKEQIMISAARISQISASIKAAADRMILTGVTTKAQFRLGNWMNEPCSGSWYINANTDCLFRKNGGDAQSYADALSNLPANIYDPIGMSNWGVDLTTTVQYLDIISGLLTISGVGTSGSSVFMLIGLKKDVCQTLNKGVGLASIPNENYAAWPTIMVANPGYSNACYFDGDAYIYYSVVVPG